MSKSRDQEKGFHWLMRRCGEQYLEMNADLRPDEGNKRALKSYLRRLKEIEEAMKAVAKAKAYMTGEPQFSRILLPKSRGGGSSNLDWHDYSTLINIVYRDFPALFGVDPPIMESDKQPIE